MSYFTTNVLKSSVVGESPRKKIVNLDGEELLRDVIWLIGAPTAQTVVDLAAAITPNTDIVICADLDSFRRVQDSKEVYKLPTNFRSHYGKSHRTMGTIRVTDDRSFIEAQEDTSQALVDILNLAKENKIPTFFAIVKRNLRPTYLAQDVDGTIRPTNILSKKILNELMNYPAGETKGETKGEQDKETEKNMRDACLHHGTYLADVLTVGCALVKEGWGSYSMEANAVVAHDGTFPAEGFITKPLYGVAYAKSSFTVDKNGLFKSFKSTATAVSKMVEKLNDILVNPKKCFRNSTVFHDALLNDIDDLPAIELIKRCSISMSDTRDTRNYSF